MKVGVLRSGSDAGKMAASLALCIWTHVALAGGGPLTEEPRFVEPIRNVTIAAGRDVKLSCVVDNLGTYKVAWIAYDKSAILTVRNNVITRNPRVGVNFDGHRTWTLHISRVNASDAGTYMCQLNTIVAKSQFGVLSVVVPPNIVDGESSGDVKVEEGANITLECSATGTPPPTITWRRETRANININATTHVVEQEGEALHLAKVTRHDMGHYLCIASNGVPPMVSKRIKVEVEFPPLLSVGNQLVGVPVGYDVELDCTVQARPPALTYWARGKDFMLHAGNKYHINETLEERQLPYRTNMKLTIANVTQEDYGNYKCVAENAKGETDGKIALYDSRHHPQQHQQAPNSVMRGRASNQEDGEAQLVTAGGRGGGGGGDPKERNDVIQLEERQKWEDGSGAGEGRGRHTQHDGSAAVSFSSTAVMGCRVSRWWLLLLTALLPHLLHRQRLL